MYGLFNTIKAQTMKTSVKIPRIHLRFDDEILLKRTREEAKKNRRSLNAEILFRLASTLQSGSPQPG
jgi:Arc-like DNA binding domain